MVEVAAILFSAAIAFGAGFQLTLAAGAPWGHLTMGGRFPGRLPAPMRAAAVFQALVLVGLAVVVLVRAGFLFPNQLDLASTVIWVVLAISCVSLLVNLITPSKPERALWAPVALVMVVTSLIVTVG